MYWRKSKFGMHLYKIRCGKPELNLFEKQTHILPPPVLPKVQTYKNVYRSGYMQ